MNEPKEKAWVDVTYRVTIVEERTVRIPLPDDYNNETEDGLLSSCRETARRVQAAMISKPEHMKIAKLTSHPPIIHRVCYEDGKGNPDASNTFEFKNQ